MAQRFSIAPAGQLLYVSLIAGEWSLVYYVWKRGLRWRVLLSINAGISEELVFRGVAPLLRVAVFGIAHDYQGVQSCIAIGIYGALFTMPALWRQSLRPGMIAHAWTDIVGGLLG